MEKFLIVGSGGREAAFAKRLAEDSIVHAVADHANPSIVAAVTATGGQYTIAKSDDPQAVLTHAQQYAVDYVFVSADNPLAAGVVDVLLAHNIKAVGPTRAAAAIEWDKLYAIKKMQAVCPQYTPAYQIATTAMAVALAMQQFADEGKEVVVKPQGLTGGKGVQVMGEHLADYAACRAYANSLVAKDGAVLLTEKLSGEEFTVMGLTDGENLVLAPATYDYPYRFDGDRGPGTGGMGCWTAANGKLPFLTNADIATCREIMQAVLAAMRADGLHFNGVLNGGFFKTANGIRFMEFNGRFGDPEALNILLLLQTPFSQLIKSIWHKTLSPAVAQFAAQASVVKYLVAPEYPSPSPVATHYRIDERAITASGVQIFYASTVRYQSDTGDKGGGDEADGEASEYETLKKSRVLALGTTAATPHAAAMQINTAIDAHIHATANTPPLAYRRDIAIER